MLVVTLCVATAPSGAVAQSYTWAKDLINPPGQVPFSLGGPAGDWNGDGIGDFGVSFAGGVIPGRMRILSGFDYGVLAEWIGSYLPLPFGDVERPGRGAGFADVDGDGARDLLMSTSESYLGSLPFVGNARAISQATGSEIYTVWGAAGSDAVGYILFFVGGTSGNGV